MRAAKYDAMHDERIWGAGQPAVISSYDVEPAFASLRPVPGARSSASLLTVLLFSAFHMHTKNGLRLAVDIGGTFTDTVLVDGRGISLPPPRHRPLRKTRPLGRLRAPSVCWPRPVTGWSQIGGFIHGTTLATNALIERRGAVVATVTSEGFRDILEIAYERRYSQYDINLVKPDLIVPRARAFTIGGRMDARGQELATAG